MSYKQGDLIKNDRQAPLPLVTPPTTPPPPPINTDAQGITASPPVIRHLMPGTNLWFPEDYPGGIDAPGDQYNEFLFNIKELYSDLHAGESTIAQKADYGYGIGLDASYIYKNDADLVSSGDWNRLFGLMVLMSTHQSTSIGDTPAAVQIGDIIDAIEGPATGLEKAIQDLQTNRFNISASQVILSDKLSASNDTLNVGDSTHIVRATFPNWNSARYFFNSGGAIRFSAAGAAPWDTSLNSMGIINFRAITTLVGGTGATTSNGFYQLTTTPLEIVRVLISGQTGSYYAINAYLSQVPGSGAPDVTINFNIVFHNAFAAIPGTFISRVAELKSGGVIPYADTVVYTQDGVSEDLNIAATSTSLFGERTGTGPVTTNATTLSTTGGTAPYSYTWAFLSGKVSGVTINNADGNTTASITDSSVTQGTTDNGVIRATIVDSSIPPKSTIQDIPWATRAYTDMTVTINPPSVNHIIQGSGIAEFGPITVSIVGGSGGYTYQWSVTGGPYISGPSTSASVMIQAFLTSPQVITGTLTCNVQDSLGNTASASITVRFEAQQVYPALVAGAPTVTSSSGNCTVPVGQTTCTTIDTLTQAATGGSGNYSFLWTVSDPTGSFTTSPNGQPTMTITADRAPGTYYADVSYVVTDTTTGNTAQSPVTRVTVTHFATATPVVVTIDYIIPSRSQNATLPIDGQPSTFSWSVGALVTGGTPPYTYNWIPTTDILGGPAWEVRLGTETLNPTTVDFRTFAAGNFGHFFRCTATDSLGVSGYVDFDLAAVVVVSCVAKADQYYTAAGSYTVLADDGNIVLIDASGGGGGGGCGTQYATLSEWTSAGSGGGGGAGGWVKDYPLQVSTGDVISWTIGGGGAGGTNNPTSDKVIEDQGGGTLFERWTIYTLSGSPGGETRVSINGQPRLILGGGGAGAGYWMQDYSPIETPEPPGGNGRAHTTFISPEAKALFNPSCFPAGTKITMADNTEKEIQDLIPGDLVLGKDGVNKVLSNTVTKLGTTRQMYRNPSTDLHWSGEHVFCTDSGWWAIDKIQLNAECYLAMGTQGLDWAETVTIWDNKTLPNVMTITSFEKLQIELAADNMQDPETVLYDVEVSGCHTMFANGFAVIAGAIFVIGEMEK